MTKKPPRLLDVGPDGSVRLPADVLESLEIAPGGKVALNVDTRHKVIRLERHVEDPWAEALRDKNTKGFDDLLSDQEARDREAHRIFEERLKEPPPKRKPEDDPDLWR